MVLICDKPYNNVKYDHLFNDYPFTLSDFQKYAFEAIYTNNNVLVTAHTGSGKTVPAEFTIEHIVKQGKKVIYTTPLKALSNQKFNDLTKKYSPNISIGVLTRDIQHNLNADVLIMTTEILRNNLERRDTDRKDYLTFDIDIDNALGAVIFDEVHFFSDRDRGIVWEQCLMWLPKHIQLVMLSASISNPESFASWIEKISPEKQIYLTSTDYRVVPLVHHVLTCMPPSEFRYMKEKFKTEFEALNKYIGKPLVIKDSSKSFHEDNVLITKKIKEYISKQRIHISYSYVLNYTVRYLKENNLLPTIWFVLSRSTIEKYAKQIEVTLFDVESTIPSTIEHDCEHILRSKLSNFNEFLILPQYIDTIKLLKKGIGMHHAGILPILREMIEILLVQKKIMLLLCTETFAVGLNMPAKAVVMSSPKKFDGSTERFLMSDEYLQMAGRAGRRGFDTIGHVILCSNLFDMPSMIEYKQLLNGKPRALVSHYQVSMDTILLSYQSGKTDVNDITSSSSNSYVNIELDGNIEYQRLECDALEKQLLVLHKPVPYDEDKINEYMSTLDTLDGLKQNRRNKVTKQLEKNKLTILNFKLSFEYYVARKRLVKEIFSLNKQINNTNQYFNNQTMVSISFLNDLTFINDSDKSITELGNVALFIKEVPNLVMSRLILDTNFFSNLSVADLIVLFSVYNDTRVKDDFMVSLGSIGVDESIYKVLTMLNEIHNYTIDIGLRHSIPLNLVDINYNMICVKEWLMITDEQESIMFFSSLKSNYDLTVGDFSKAVIKIDNIASEMIKIAEHYNNLELLNKLKDISPLLLKFIITTQSLYV